MSNRGRAYRRYQRQKQIRKAVTYIKNQEFWGGGKDGNYLDETDPKRPRSWWGTLEGYRIRARQRATTRVPRSLCSCCDGNPRKIKAEGLKYQLTKPEWLNRIQLKEEYEDYCSGGSYVQPATVPATIPLVLDPTDI